MKRLLFAAALLASSPACAQPAEGIPADTFAEQLCGGNYDMQTACMMYAMGVISTHQVMVDRGAVPLFCLPGRHTSNDTFRAMIVDWHRNAKRRGLDFTGLTQFSAVAMAMAEAFPCN